MPRVLPNDPVAEETIIGICLKDSEKVHEALALVSHDDFFSNKNAMVYEAIRAVYERGLEVSETTVAHELSRRSRLDAIGGQARLAQYLADLSGNPDCTYFAETIRKDAILRRIIAAGENISKLAASSNADLEVTVSDSLNALESAVTDTTVSKIISLDSVVSEDYDDFFKTIDNPSVITGLSWGSDVVDQMTGGMRGSMFYIIAGRPSMGKTSFTISIVTRLIRTGVPVLYFTREMPPKEIKNRIAFSIANVDWNAVRLGRAQITPQNKKDLVAAMQAMQKWPLYLDYTSGDAVQMKMRIREGVRRHGVQAVFVDHIDITSAKAGSFSANRNNEVMFITHALKEAAMEHDIPVIGLSQLSRETERRQNKIPQLADLRDSGSKEQDAQGVLMLFRPVYYETNEQGQRGFNANYRHLDDLLIVNLAKNTYGPVGLVGYSFKEGTGQCYGYSAHDSAKYLGIYQDYLDSQDD